MKIYNRLTNDDPNFSNGELPVEWAYFEYDAPLETYIPKEGDKDHIKYSAVIRDREYHRVEMLRRYLCEYYEVNDLDELCELLKESELAMEYSFGQFVIHGCF